MASVFAVTKANGPHLVAQATGTAASAQGEISGILWAERAIVTISGLTSETVSITGSFGLAGTDVYTGKLRPWNLVTGAVEATDSDLSNGDFEFRDLAFNSLKFTKSSTSETPTITVRLKGRV